MEDLPSRECDLHGTAQATRRHRRQNGLGVNGHLDPNHAHVGLKILILCGSSQRG